MPEKNLNLEQGIIKKPFSKHFLKIALVYPNSYFVGMSNLGLHTLYKIWNNLDEVLCERVFFNQDQEPLSLEGKHPLKSFDLIAFTVSFENDYLNVLSILKASGIPLRAKVRKNGSYPLILGGGAALSFNPEPMADFFDLIAIGEGENIAVDLANILKSFSGKGSLRKENICKELSTIPGLYWTDLDEEARLKIRSQYISDLDQNISSTQILTANTHFSDTFLVEVQRGCPHHCFYCALGNHSRIYRVAKKEIISKCVQEAAQAWSVSKVGLLGSAIFADQLQDLLLDLDPDKYEITTSSLRIDQLNYELVKNLVQRGQKTITLAPEVGAEKLRYKLGKKISNQNILDSAEIVFASDANSLKLYFMVGLPEETFEDLQEILKLIGKIRHLMNLKCKPRGRLIPISISLSCFVPKAGTPLQWSEMASLKDLTQKLKFLTARLRKLPNLSVTHDIAKWAQIQGILARGDRRVADILENVLDHHGNWNQVLKQSEVNPGYYIYRSRDADEKFPWDFLSEAEEKQRLYQIYQKFKD